LSGLFSLLHSFDIQLLLGTQDKSQDKILSTEPTILSFWLRSSKPILSHTAGPKKAHQSNIHALFRKLLVYFVFEPNTQNKNIIHPPISNIGSLMIAVIF
jgi:hypothetical protein